MNYIINHKTKIYFQLPFDGWNRFDKSNLHNIKQLFWDIYYVIYNSSAKDDEIYSSSNDLTNLFYINFSSKDDVEISDDLKYLTENFYKEIKL
jgi:hypothetical protein